MMTLSISDTTSATKAIKEDSTVKKFTTDLLVVLDLDETLYRFPRSEEEHASFWAEGVEQEKDGVDHGILAVSYKSNVVPLKLRPGVLDFLKATALSRRYEVHIFTAGECVEWANNAIDALAKAVVGKEACSDLFAGRWFQRDCIDYGSYYLKPLRKVVRASRADAGVISNDYEDEDSELKRVVIVDNNPDSYFLAKNNGIPVSDYEGDNSEEDSTFQKVLELLCALENVEDVRPVLKAKFESRCITYRGYPYYTHSTI